MTDARREMTPTLRIRGGWNSEFFGLTSPAEGRGRAPAECVDVVLLAPGEGVVGLAKCARTAGIGRAPPLRLSLRTGSGIEGGHPTHTRRPSMRPSLKTLFVMTALLLAASLGSAVAPRPAAAADVDVDISVFYTSLAPYGEWVQLDSYGWSWVPENVEYDWRPYTLGRWEWVEPYGWTWGSDEPFGWATYHYGRWTYLDDYGWVWVPGTTWGPAWVAFRYGDPWVGWAPLPPGSNWRFDAAFEVAGLNLDVSIGSFAWSFVPLRYFAEPDLRSRVFVTAYSPYFVERTRWSTRYAAIDGGYANFGVDLVIVEKARGSAVTRHRLREAAVLGSGARVSGGEVVLYRPPDGSFSKHC